MQQFVAAVGEQIKDVSIKEAWKTFERVLCSGFPEDLPLTSEVANGALIPMAHTGNASTLTKSLVRLVDDVALSHDRASSSPAVQTEKRSNPKKRKSTDDARDANGIHVHPFLPSPLTIPLPLCSPIPSPPPSMWTTSFADDSSATSCLAMRLDDGLLNLFSFGDGDDFPYDNTPLLEGGLESLAMHTDVTIPPQEWLPDPLP